jgi:hypothetical protein
MLRRLETYLNRVFDWAELMALMAEGRQHPRPPWAQVFQALFLVIW